MQNLIQMLLSQKIKQIPQNLMSQMQMQLKRVNPQAYQEYLKARQDKVSGEEYLNQITSKFTPEQKREWEGIVGQFIQKR